MVELFRDPIWQFIGVVFAFLAIVLTIYLFVRGRAKKALTYMIGPFIPFLTMAEELRGDFHILYKGNEIRNLYLIGLKVTNSGNVPVESKDYEKPISFSFGEHSKVYSAELVKTQPATLSCMLSISENRVTLSPILLNAGDSLEIKCLVTESSRAAIMADGRISGVVEISERRISFITPFATMTIGIFFILAATAYILSTPASVPQTVVIESKYPSWPPLLLAITGMGFSIYGLIILAKSRILR